MFGQMVLAHRQRLGLTQEELAHKTGLSVRSIRDVEAGRVRAPRQVSVQRLADAFGLAGPDLERFRYHASGAGEAAPAVPANGYGARVPPAQLPMRPHAFAGRVAHLAHLDGLLSTVDRGEAGTVALAVITGTAGVGKTALAVHWAHQVADRFPDGQLYVNLRGFDPTGPAVRPADVLRGFLDALGVPAQGIPADLSEQSALYRSLLAGRRVVVVLDNARNAEQVRPLLPGSPGCLVLVTSRDQLTGLVAVNSAQPLTLDLFTAAEARELLIGRLGPHRVAAEPQAIDEIITLCAWLPLAMVIVAARAATWPAFPLTVLVDEVRETRGSLDAFVAGQDAATDVRAVFSWSYRTLSAEAADLFRSLGLGPGPDVAVPAAASVAGVPLAQVRPLLAELTRAHLATEHVPGRYTMHDLLSAYAAELSRRHDTEARQRAAMHRLLDHYVQTAYAANALLFSHRDMITLPPACPGTARRDFGDLPDAVAWLTVERQALLAAMRRAASDGFDAHTWQLGWALDEFLARQGHWYELLETQRAGLAAAERLGDQVAQAHAHRGLSHAYVLLGRVQEAETHLLRALDLYRQVGDRSCQAHTEVNFVNVLESQPERWYEAMCHVRQALALFVDADDRAGQARALNAAGWLRAQRGEHEQAIAYCLQALEIQQRIGDGNREAFTVDSLGFAHHQLGHHRQAIAYYQRALKLCQGSGDRCFEARILSRLGDTHRAAGDPDSARRIWRRALELFDEAGSPDANLVRARLDRLDQPNNGRSRLG